MNAAMQLLTRIGAGFRWTFTGQWLKPDSTPTRAGVLNTGELIVLLKGGGMLVLSSEDTEMVADVMLNARSIDLTAVGGASS